MWLQENPAQPQSKLASDIRVLPCPPKSLCLKVCGGGVGETQNLVKLNKMNQNPSPA